MPLYVLYVCTYVCMSGWLQVWSFPPFWVVFLTHLLPTTYFSSTWIQNQRTGNTCSSMLMPIIQPSCQTRHVTYIHPPSHSTVHAHSPWVISCKDAARTIYTVLSCLPPIRHPGTTLSLSLHIYLYLSHTQAYPQRRHWESPDHHVMSGVWSCEQPCYEATTPSRCKANRACHWLGTLESRRGV